MRPEPADPLPCRRLEGKKGGVLGSFFARLIWYYSEECFRINVMLRDYSKIRTYLEGG